MRRTIPVRVRPAIAAILLASAVCLASTPAYPHPPAKPELISKTQLLSTTQLPCTDSQPDEQSAMAMARRCGRPVEAMAKRTESDRVLANPKGTFTLERGAAPRRVRRDDGSWAPIDTTLAKAADGTVAPKATTGRVRFSGGGRSPLVSMPVTGGTLEVSWPGVLPVPVLDGDAAVYRDLLPGVDLRLRAVTTGFTYAFVVKTRAAAANPALRSIRLPIRTTGVTVRDRKGGIEIVDRSGKTVLTSTGATMWDSATARPALTASGTAARSGHRQPITDQERSLHGRTGAPMVSTANEAGELAVRSTVGARMSGRDLVLTPDARMLTAPETVFPLYIDPPAGYLAWAYSNQWEYDNMTWGEVWAGLNPADGAIYRGYFAFWIGDLVGKHVVGANFNAVLKHSYDCNPTPATMVRGQNPSGYRTEFDTPLWQWVEDVQWANAHKISNGVPACWDDPQPDTWMTWSGDLAAQIEANKGQNGGTITLAVTAGDHGDEWVYNYWKKFYTESAFMNVDYNLPPSAPAVSTVPDLPCVTGPGRPHVSALPQLVATASDPEGDNVKARFEWWYTGGSAPIGSSATGTEVASGNPVTYTFNPAELPDGGTYSWRAQGGDPWNYGDLTGFCEFTFDSKAPSALATTPVSFCTSTATATDTASLPRLNPGSSLKLKTTVDDPNGGTTQAEFEWWRKADRDVAGATPLSSLLTSPPAAVGSQFQASVTGSTLTNGQAYSWRARGNDGGFVKPWTPWCEFVVDTTVPTAPTLTAAPGNSVTPVPAPTTAPAPGASAITGRPTQITFKPAGGTADPSIAGYLWSLTDSGGTPTRWAPADANGNAVVTVEPSVNGPFAANKVTLLAVDRAGNRSALPSNGYSFSFKTNPMAGWWPTTGTAGPVLDATSYHNDLTTAGGATLGYGVMTLNGTDGQAVGPAPAFDSSTSFTISAWVRPTALTSNRTAVSQDGLSESGPRLQYNAASNAWCFVMSTSDTAAAPVVKSCATAAPTKQVWAHLAGTYNAATNAIALFVNGTQVDSDAYTTPWAAGGPIAVGRGLASGAAGEWFAGDVADIRAWPLVLDTAGITALSKVPPMAGRWMMDDPIATAASDQSGIAAAHNATLTTGGAGWSNGGRKGYAMALDGASGKASTSTATVRTDQSFTVSAWVYTGDTSTSTVHTALTQQSSTRGGYFLQQRNGFWAFGRPASSTSSTIAWATSTAAATPNTWVHLSGVYDSGAAQIKLYVNGALAATTACSCAWNAGSAMTFGRTQWPQPDAEWWPGRLDDVRVFRGALSTAQIAYLATQ